jgi:hypothetical protein
LFSLTKGFDGKYSVQVGDVHYTGAGYQQIAVQVAGAIENALP